MTSKAYITYYRGFLITALYEDEKLVEVFADDPKSKDLLDRIYVGKVKNVVKNIQAAFIDIGQGEEGYYSLIENKHPIFLSPKKNDTLVQGDELLVQVCRDKIKTKSIALTSELSFAGKYMVLKSGRNFVRISSKIRDNDQRSYLTDLFQNWTEEDIGFVVRTQAVQTDEAVLEKECCALKEKYRQTLAHARMLTCFSEVYAEPAGYIRRLKSMESRDFIKIETDIKEVYDALLKQGVGALSQQGLVFYDDPQMPLVKLLSLETKIGRILDPKVWLKSGGFLVIEVTEALTVIDVNSGRYMGKKDTEEAFLKVNLEAADEIARQLRLRNLSGMILIDFIDMRPETHKKQLMKHLKAAVANDPMRPAVIDMTHLGLVEMTRKKERRPLHEQLLKRCPQCHGRGML